MKQLGRLISKHRVAILIIALLLMIPAALGAMRTPISYDILTYLPQNLDSVKGQNILDQTFSNAATSMLIMEDTEAKDVVKIKERLSEIEGVEKILWIDDLLDTSVPKDILPDNIRDLFYRENSTLLFIQFNESSSSPITMDAIDEIRSIMDDQSYLAGLSAIVKDTKALADEETPFYVGLAVVLCILVLMIAMESYVVPFIFIISIGVAVVYNLGTNSFLGNMSYITKALAAVLQLGVTMDYSIFLLHRYDEEKEKTEDKNEAMAEAIAKTFTSIIGSSLTTVAGFLALCTMSLTIGKDIGLVMAKGVLFGVVTTVTVLPALILIFDKPIHKYQHRTLLPQFHRTAGFVTKHYKLFAIVFIIAFLPSIYGQRHTEVYYNLDQSLPEDLPSVIATKKLKDDYDMTTTHFIIMDDEVPSYRIRDMIEEIKALDGIENVIGYDSIVGPGIPDSFIPQDVRDFTIKGGYKMILVNSEYKAATDEGSNQIIRLNKIVKSYDEDGIVTGEGPLTYDMIELADKDFKNSSFFSIVSVFVIVLFVFFSLSIPVILVLCIELAIFTNMAIPFYAGQVLPFIASIIIGSVQLGATVDYAILLTTRFREEIRSGKDKFEAMRISIEGSARSIVTSALSLFAATIGVGIIADMEIIKTLCIMLGRGAIISMIVIIYILPSILLVTEGLVAATSKNWRSKSHVKLSLAKEEN